MVFADNSLHLSHSTSGLNIAFDPLSALKHVDDSKDLVHVATAKKWQEAR